LKHSLWEEGIKLRLCAYYGGVMVLTRVFYILWPHSTYTDLFKISNQWSGLFCWTLM